MSQQKKKAKTTKNNQTKDQEIHSFKAKEKIQSYQSFNASVWHQEINQSKITRWTNSKPQNNGLKPTNTLAQNWNKPAKVNK